MLGMLIINKANLISLIFDSSFTVSVIAQPAVTSSKALTRSDDECQELGTQTMDEGGCKT